MLLYEVCSEKSNCQTVFMMLKYDKNFRRVSVQESSSIIYEIENTGDITVILKFA